MTAAKNQMPTDSNSNPIPVMKLNASEDIDGTSNHDESAAIQGNMVRIVAIDGDIRFLIGEDPEALEDSHFLGDHQEIYQPCNIGDKVSVLGGPANIATLGE
jgi:hypothetical protein